METLTRKEALSVLMESPFYFRQSIPGRLACLKEFLAPFEPKTKENKKEEEKNGN
jgi:hypothetical protein